MADDLVDRLPAQTGLHVGNSQQTPQEIEAVARIMVTTLPGRSGVTFDYEGLSQNQDRPRPHAEHAVLGRTSSGLALYTAHIHGGGAWGALVLTELRETEPGYFEAAKGASPFPLAIRVEVPSAGRLIYTWSFGEPDGALSVRNTADLRLVD